MGIPAPFASFLVAQLYNVLENSSTIAAWVIHINLICMIKETPPFGVITGDKSKLVVSADSSSKCRHPGY
jgi:hypothetical protein